MIIYPAIDIRAGNCVRLYQGDYSKEKIYHDSPIDMAKHFMAQGATWLHLVDLDGAKDPNENQASLIKKILQTVPIKVQVGGGIRTEAQIDAYLNNGANRVVLGSLAVVDPSLVLTWLRKYGPERLVLAFDVKLDEVQTPFVVTQAWGKISQVELFEALTNYAADLQHVLCTDVSRDGALSGPSIGLYQILMAKFPQLCIQASGGIASLDDLRQLKKLGCGGAITGRALYEKKFGLREALIC